MKSRAIDAHPVTGLDHPHYDVSIIMSSATFESITGVLFEAKLSFANVRKPVHAKLVVPKDLNDPALNLAINAWLWLEEDIACAAGDRFILQLKCPCDSAHEPDRIDALKPFSGYTFVGFIHRNWNL